MPLSGVFLTCCVGSYVRLLSQANTAQIGRKTPTKGSCSSQCAVITITQFLQGRIWSEHLFNNKYCVVLNTEEVLVRKNSTQNKHGARSARGKTWLYVYSIGSRGSFILVLPL